MFWVSVQAGALAAGEKYGVDVQWNGPAQETEYDRQIQIVDSMIARRVDGLAVAATERNQGVEGLSRSGGSSGCERRRRHDHGRAERAGGRR